MSKTLQNKKKFQKSLKKEEGGTLNMFLFLLGLSLQSKIWATAIYKFALYEGHSVNSETRCVGAIAY